MTVLNVLSLHSEMMQAQMIHKRQKAKMMKDLAHGTIDVEKTEVGRVRGKLQKLMAKQMDGNPAFKRRVEDFKKLMNSSKNDEQLRMEFERKMSVRRESKIERSKTIEMRKAKEDAMQEVIEADMQNNDVSNLTAADSGSVDKSKEATILDNVSDKTPTSKAKPKDWIALHV